MSPSEWYVVLYGACRGAFPSYAEAQRAAHGRNATVGGPFPSPESALRASVETLDADLRDAWRAWERAEVVGSRT